jgi:hypothetical protein
MRLVRGLLLGVGAVALLMGVVWIGQGTGVFPYPASSFMIDQMPWAYRGIGLALAGLVVIVVSRRI